MVHVKVLLIQHYVPQIPGYLTRRLVDVAQDIIIREEDCITYSSLSLNDLFKKYKTDLSLENRLIGRLLAKPTYDSGRKFNLSYKYRN